MKQIMLMLAGLILASGACFGQYSIDRFNPNANHPVRAIVVQPDGNILLGGDFTTLDGSGRPFVGRVLANGHIDTAFNPASAGAGPGDSVYAMALQTDGKVLIGGAFATING